MTTADSPGDGADSELVAHGIAFMKLVEPAARMSEADFAAEFGAAFLVIVTDRPAQPRHLGRTEARTINQPRATADEATGDTRVFVLPLRKKPTNRSPWLRIGRGDSCDLVVVDLSISKLHAFVQQDEAGNFSVLDAGSRNGTFVDENEVAARGIGPAKPLAASAKVRFGSVSMTFVTAAQLQNSARQRHR